MSVKTLADGNVKVTLLATAPADINAITIDELTGVGARDLSCNILSSDYDLGPTGSDTNDEKPLCVKGNAQTFGPSNFGGGFTPFRYFDPESGQPDEDDDWVWDAVKAKGTTLHVVERESHKESGEPWAEDNEYRYYEILSDDPVRGERTGYVKYRINAAVQRAALDKRVVAGETP
ncbi:MAG TPA: hypothetical protein VEP72_01870 [Microbacterium sp.]|nr:hypothetical protein [Microbacterium sp.]